MLMNRVLSDRVLRVHYLGQIPWRLANLAIKEALPNQLPRQSLSAVHHIIMPIAQLAGPIRDHA